MVEPNERSTLETLARIIHEVDRSPDLEAALRVVVERTRALMMADVCSIYFTDHEKKQHVVVATDGLAPAVVGQLRWGFGKGLIGRVAESAQPINLSCVPEAQHQEFMRRSGAGPFRGFLGVPITHRSRVLGVLVVRQRIERRFDNVDTAVLTTLAAQLGGAVAFARASGLLHEPYHPEGTEPEALEGLPGAPGIAVGTGVVVYASANLEAVPDRETADIVLEERRFRDALNRVSGEIERLGATHADTMSALDLALFDAYALMLNSEEIVDTTVQHIHQGNWAPGALRQTIETHIRRFEAIDDPYLRERGTDIRDLGNRLLMHLQDAPATIEEYPPNTILIGHQLGAIDLALAPSERLRGVISAEGSSLSHVAILSRSLGIPAVMGFTETRLEQLNGQTIVLDGHSGRVYPRPNSRLRQATEHLARDEQALEEDLKPLKDLPARTIDGVEIALYANVGLSAEVPLAMRAGAQGVGLFRSELPFMLYDRFPSEEEQVGVYRQVLEALAPRPVTLRTLDIGGDKPLPYLTMKEANPALGQRGIRLTLDHPEIFLTQLRAALRADVGLNNLRLLLPMVNGVTDVERSLALIEQSYSQLLEEEVAVVRPPVGIMIEVPSAVYQAEELARRVDFLSVGSNDLTQYLLAIDRGNPAVSSRLDPLHPAVLRALHQVVEAARQAGKPVSLCGEMAADPGSALLLMGLGFDSLSISAGGLPRVKWAIRSVDFQQLKLLAQQALRLEEPESVRRLLEATLEKAGLNRLLPRTNTLFPGDDAPG